MRASKENTEFYKTTFSLMFQTCHTDFPQFEPEDSPKGIIVDWSRLKLVGEEAADCLLRGCNVASNNNLLISGVMINRYVKLGEIL